MPPSCRWIFLNFDHVPFYRGAIYNPEIARLYYEAYSGIASLFPEGSEERNECLKILEIVKSGGNR